ncbi:unnamed protein product [Linum trigynum]|uniref:Reverse transcriptase n=1 Tax=Linum trigynum TaxID=586398 RepID=A0AAV2DWT2_9ROSI
MNFFHRTTLARRKRNTIKRLWDDSGRWHVGQQAVSNYFVQNYQHLFTVGDSPQSWPVLESFPRRLEEYDNEALLRPFSREEIFDALKQMGKRKAPGADGLSVFFFRRYWHVIGDEVVANIVQILTTGMKWFLSFIKLFRRSWLTG